MISAMAPETTPNPSIFSKLSFLSMLALVALGGVFYMAGKNIEAGKINTPGTLTITGDAKTFATPNLGQIMVGVQIDRQDSAADAMVQLKDRMTQVLEAMKQLGVTDKDIRVSGLSLGPSYDYSNGQQRLEGYTASQMVTVKTKALDKLGDILNAATDAGANQAGDVQFIVENPDAKKDEARKIAVVEAQKKAQEMATQLGVVLGSLKSYTETPGGAAPTPIYMRSAVGASADAGSIPLPSGEQEVTMNVTLTYEVK
jgi:uncharacterized protein YggE